jgi:hypothetical protein
MKAVVYRRYGGPEVLEYTDVPDPKFAQNSMLVRVRRPRSIRRTTCCKPAWARATPTHGSRSSPDGMSPVFPRILKIGQVQLLHGFTISIQ